MPITGLREQWTLRKLSQESPQRPSASSSETQANEENALGGTDELDGCHRVGHRSFGYAGPSRDMHIEALEKDIALLDHCLRQW